MHRDQEALHERFVPRQMRGMLHESGSMVPRTRVVRRCSEARVFVVCGRLSGRVGSRRVGSDRRQALATPLSRRSGDRACNNGLRSVDTLRTVAPHVRSPEQKGQYASERKTSGDRALRRRRANRPASASRAHLGRFADDRAHATRNRVRPQVDPRRQRTCS